MKMGNLARGQFDISKVEYIVPGVVPESEHRLALGDVLLNTRNTLDLVGKVAIWRAELPVAYYNSNLMRLEFDGNEVESNEYMSYSLNSANSVARLREFATGTTSVAAIYTRDLMGLQVVLPPKKEQRAIAAALNDVDALIETLDRLIAKKRDLKQAAMQQLLTAKTRLPGFSGEWELRPLLRCVRIANGQVDPRQEPFRSMVLVAPDHIERNTGRLLARQTAAEQAAISGKYVFGVGEIVYSKIRPYLRKAILADFDGLCSADMYPLAPAHDVCAGFILQVLLGERFSQFAESVSVRSGMPKINRQEMAGFEVALPPMEEQTAIATILTDMDAELTTLEQRRDKTRLIKQGMMQELLTGRTRLV